MLTDADRQDIVLEALQTLLPDPQDDKQAVIELYYFRNKRGAFKANARCWKHTNENWMFWTSIKDDAPTLAKLAIRILSTAANSVPSERAFSTMKLQHMKLRNRLLPSRVDKLVFIHINQRILTEGPKRLYEMAEQEVLQLERDLAVLLDEGYLYSELATEIQQREDPNMHQIKDAKWPAAEQRPGLGRNGRIQDHFRGAPRPEASPDT
jgi:hAT family C-terminal dimerisation region